MNRFSPEDQVIHNGRPATVAAVKVVDGSPRYTIFYNDGDHEVRFDLLGRVLSVAK